MTANMTRAILTDIEGTTTDIAFVHKVLFPYARAHIADFVHAHANDPSVREQLAAVSQEAGRALDDEQAIAQLIRWIDEDKKITPLKALQGVIWEQGYRNGDFTGHVYADVPGALRRWQAEGKKLYVYSSGSVQAQKLIFGYTPFGDLTQLFSGYFDTRIGGKREVESYQRIAQEIGILAQEIMFLSDVFEELEAAKQAGMHTRWLVRGSKPDPKAAHHQVPDFKTVS